MQAFLVSGFSKACYTRPAATWSASWSKMSRTEVVGGTATARRSACPSKGRGAGGSRWRNANLPGQISGELNLCAWSFWYRLCTMSFQGQPTCTPGPCRLPGVQTLPEARNLEAHPELLPSGSRWGAVPLASISNPKSLGGFYLHWDTEQQVTGDPWTRQSKERRPTISPTLQEGSSPLLATGSSNVKLGRQLKFLETLQPLLSVQTWFKHQLQPCKWCFLSWLSLRRSRLAKQISGTGPNTPRTLQSARKTAGKSTVNRSKLGAEVFPVRLLFGLLGLGTCESVGEIHGVLFE